MVKNILLSLITALAVLIFGFFLAELTVRILEPTEKSEGWHDPNTEFDSELGWRPIKNGNLTHEWGKISSNSLGYRSREIVSGKKKIVLLGDSVTWGYGIDDKKIASAILEDKFENSDFQVLNLGVSGYDLGQYYLHLKNNLEHLKPLSRVILVIHVTHDLKETSANVTYGKTKPLYRIHNNQLVLTGTPIHKYSLQNIISMSEFIRKVLARWPGLNKYTDILTGTTIIDEKELEQVATQLVQQMKLLVESAGGQFNIVLSPAITEFRNPSIDYRWFKQMCMEGQYGCLDLFPVLRKQTNLRSLYIDPHHYSEKGNQLIASVLYERIGKSS